MFPWLSVLFGPHKSPQSVNDKNSTQRNRSRVRLQTYHQMIASFVYICLPKTQNTTYLVFPKTKKYYVPCFHIDLVSCDVKNWVTMAQAPELTSDLAFEWKRGWMWLLLCKSSCSLMLTTLNLHEKSREVCETRSPAAFLAFIGQVTKHITVKWSIVCKDLWERVFYRKRKELSMAG